MSEACMFLSFFFFFGEEKRGETACSLSTNGQLFVCDILGPISI